MAGRQLHIVYFSSRAFAQRLAAAVIKQAAGLQAAMNVPGLEFILDPSATAAASLLASLLLEVAAMVGAATPALFTQVSLLAIQKRH